MTEQETETVRFRAYQIWDHEGRPHGRDEEHWHQALNELGLDTSSSDETRYSIAAQTREWDAAEQDQ